MAYCVQCYLTDPSSRGLKLGFRNKSHFHNQRLNKLTASRSQIIGENKTSFSELLQSLIVWQAPETCWLLKSNGISHHFRLHLCSSLCDNDQYRNYLKTTKSSSRCFKELRFTAGFECLSRQSHLVCLILTSGDINLKFITIAIADIVFIRLLIYSKVSRVINSKVIADGALSSDFVFNTAGDC